jgi:hypothetical protein
MKHILTIHTLRKQKNEYILLDTWIRTAKFYSCNDNIDGIDILSSPTCKSVDVMDIFNSTPRRNGNHGVCHYTYPIFHDVSLNDLSFIQKLLGMHHIRSTLFPLPLSKLHCTLYNSCLVNHVTNPNSNDTSLHHSFCILFVTDFSNLLTLRKVK